MDFILYNSLSHQKEIFIPKDTLSSSSSEPIVKLYVCGPTVYDFAHLGNARAMVAFDVLFRLLKEKYKNVFYIRNITDVDDKIYAASVTQKCSFSKIAQHFEKEFKQDMHSLNVCEPTQSPRATEFIPSMIDMISVLIQKGFAYEREGHVLFSVNQYPQYGQLSRKSQEELLAGARIEVATYKKNPYDFVLWKPSLPEMPGWDSPWGRGRPGWHIECSAMSSYYFGQTFDIHAGGIDLIFPHHENERAQSCCALNSSEMARFWLHNGHLTIDGKKMSKSLGNFFTVRELLSQYNPEVLRMALMTAHYRQPLDWTDSLLTMSQQLLNKWYRVLSKVSPLYFNCDWEKSSLFFDRKFEIYEFSKNFRQALYDDMNTPVALQNLNKMIQQYSQIPNEDLLGSIYFCGHLLGLFYQSADQWFQYGVDETMIQSEIEKRQQAKREKNFALADQIRDYLLEKGVLLEDSPQGTIWRKR